MMQTFHDWSILDVLHRAGVETKRVGDEWKILCPSHKEKRPSCSVNEEKGTLLCYSCDFTTSIKGLADLLGVQITPANRPRTTTPKSKSSKSKPPPKPLPSEEQIATWNQNLLQRPELLKARSWSEEIVTEYRIGLERDGVFAFPVHDESGNLVNVKYHKSPCDEDDRHKSWGVGGRSNTRLIHLAPSDNNGLPLWICEGWLDAATLRSQGALVATTSNGCNTFRNIPDELRRVAGGRDVIVAPDHDDPGRRGGADVVRIVGTVATSVRVVQWPEGTPEHHDIGDHLKTGSMDELLDLAIAVRGAIPDGTKEQSESSDRTTGTKATRLIDLAIDNGEFFHSADGTSYVDVKIDGHRETWPIDSSVYRTWMQGQLYRREGASVSPQTLKEAIGVLESEARFGGPQREVFVRVGSVDGALYLDLCNPTWEAIQITPKGWAVVADPPARFRRGSSMLPLPCPAPGGSVELLRPMVNLRDDDDFYLIVAWLVNSFRDRGPYPVGVVQGEQGSAKSSFCRVVRDLVDPARPALRRPPKGEHDLAIEARNSHIVAYDNLSGLRPWLADAICCLATGGGFATRKLYSDFEEAIFDATRPVLINGITDLVTRPDLTDRALVFSLPKIEEYRDETEFWGEFNGKRPLILGALLDAVCKCLRCVGDVRLDRLPRMADFAKWSVAAGPSLPWEPEDFLRAYAGNRGEAIELGLDSDPVAGALRELIRSRGAYEGTATQLLTALSERVDDMVCKSRPWPKSPSSLSGSLRRLAPALRKVGIRIDFPRGTSRNRTRKITIRKCEGRDFAVQSVRSVRNPPPADDSSDGVGRQSAISDGDLLSQNPGMVTNRTASDGADGEIPTLEVDATTLPTTTPSRGPCQVCGGVKYWRSTLGQDVCFRCHPPADPKCVAAVVDGSSRRTLPGGDDGLGHGRDAWTPFPQCSDKPQNAPERPIEPDREDIIRSDTSTVPSSENPLETKGLQNKPQRVPR